MDLNQGAVLFPEGGALVRAFVSTPQQCDNLGIAALKKGGCGWLQTPYIANQETRYFEFYIDASSGPATVTFAEIVPDLKYISPYEYWKQMPPRSRTVILDKVPCAYGI